MSSQSSNSSSQPDDVEVPEADVTRARFSFIWIFPIMAILVAGFLGWKGLENRGPEIVITFDTADGLTSGQTQVKNRAVTLGTVSSIRLSPNMHQVEVRVQMKAEAAPLLTTKARFWVVRPRINGASVTGLETLLSGAYIAFDPGPPGASERADHFRGLESPPGIRSDQPGQTYSLVAQSIGSIGPGAPVFFRDVDVGEVLGYTIPPGGVGPAIIQFFVREPYDYYLRTDSRFWNASGVNVAFGAGGLKVQMQSIQALFSGGIAFNMPEKHNPHSIQAPPNTVFRLYDDKESADAATYHARVPVVSYFSSSVKGMNPGSSVSMFGIQIGNVTSVKLKVDPKTGEARVRVAMELQPERVLTLEEMKDTALDTLLKTQVGLGLRAAPESVSLLTGETGVALNFVRHPAPAVTSEEDNILVIPGEAGGLGGIMESVSTLTDKLAAMPFDKIGTSAANLLTHADERINSPEVKDALVQLRDSLKSMSLLLNDTRKGVQPLMKRLPEISENLDKTLISARHLLNSYGNSGDFGRNLQSMIIQMTAAARSLRLMTTYLTNHPSSLVTGR
ncbi:MAG: MCE family protein [Acetobacter sp.]|nr:MCE family protein [Acetobacter sp.]